jgi:hypothetical protein
MPLLHRCIREYDLHPRDTYTTQPKRSFDESYESAGIIRLTETSST